MEFEGEPVFGTYDCPPVDVFCTLSGKILALLPVLPEFPTFPTLPVDPIDPVDPVEIIGAELPVLICCPYTLIVELGAAVLTVLTVPDPTVKEAPLTMAEVTPAFPKLPKPPELSRFEKLLELPKHIPLTRVYPLAQTQPFFSLLTTKLYSLGQARQARTLVE